MGATSICPAGSGCAMAASGSSPSQPMIPTAKRGLFISRVILCARQSCSYYESPPTRVAHTFTDRPESDIRIIPYRRALVGNEHT
jgi:hypothetical protein